MPVLIFAGPGWSRFQEAVISVSLVLRLTVALRLMLEGNRSPEVRKSEWQVRKSGSPEVEEWGTVASRGRGSALSSQDFRTSGLPDPGHPNPVLLSARFRPTLPSCPCLR